MINKGLLKSLEKREAMVIDDDQFPLVSSFNTVVVVVVVVDLRAFLHTKNSRRLPPSLKKKCILKQQLIHVDDMVGKKSVCI